MTVVQTNRRNMEDVQELFPALMLSLPDKLQEQALRIAKTIATATTHDLTEAHIEEEGFPQAMVAGSAVFCVAMALMHAKSGHEERALQGLVDFVQEKLDAIKAKDDPTTNKMVKALMVLYDIDPNDGEAYKRLVLKLKKKGLIP